MKRYEAYKNSGVDWIGEIPQGWEVRRIKTLFKEINERSFDGSEDLLSVSQYTGVTKKSDKVEEGDLLTNASTLEGYKIVRNGDLVSNIMLAWNGSLGFSQHDGITSPAYSIYRLKSKGEKQFFHYLFRTEKYKAEFKRQSSGVIESRLRLYSDDFFSIYSLLPPLSEQTAIAQFLDDKTAKIDQTIGIRQKEIGLLKERRQILIQQAVTGKWSMVNGQWLKTQTEKLKPSGVDWIGEIPEHWEVTPMRRLIDVRDGTHDTPFYIENSSFSHYLITSKDFEGDDINYTQAKSISRKDYEEIRKRSGVETGDVIMSMIGGNIGKSVIISTKTDIAIKNVGLFKTKGNITMSKYIRYYLQSGLLKIQAEINSKGGAQSFLSLGDLRNLRFFKMPFEDMVQIVNFIEVNISKIAKAISIKEQEIEKLKEYKTVLIDNVVTGKVRVS